MFQWVKELLDIRYEYSERKKRLREVPCKSCETLKIALERANYEREQLLNNLLKPNVVPERLVAPTPSSSPIGRRHIPWPVKQQQLELEDKERAKAIRDFQENLKREQQLKAKITSRTSDSAIPVEVNTNPQTEELERELGIN